MGHNGIYFSPIKVVPGDKAGVVRDGPDTLVDIDYQLDLSTVTVTFSGYESERDGVTRYEWAVGSAPRLDDVMPYSYVNLVTDDGGASGMLGKTTLDIPVFALLFIPEARCEAGIDTGL